MRTEEEIDKKIMELEEVCESNSDATDNVSLNVIVILRSQIEMLDWCKGEKQ
jgi:hypothetical protein